MGRVCFSKLGLTQASELSLALQQGKKVGKFSVVQWTPNAFFLHFCLIWKESGRQKNLGKWCKRKGRESKERGLESKRREVIRRGLEEKAGKKEQEGVRQETSGRESQKRK